MLRCHQRQLSSVALRASLRRGSGPGRGGFVSSWQSGGLGQSVSVCLWCDFGVFSNYLPTDIISRRKTK